MRRDDTKLNKIYDRTSGKCHLCGKKLAFKNYGRVGTRGAWEIEHSIPKARFGTDHGNNLYAAHISCNRAKGARSTRNARLLNGLSRAPLSKARRLIARRRNAVAGGVLGAMPGAMFLGPAGAILGAVVGAALGHDQDPDDG